MIVFKWLRALIRHVLVWWLPCITGLLVLLTAFLGWTLGTQPGAVFLLRTVAAQFDGEAQGIRGSVFKGLSVDRLRLTLPELTLAGEGLHLQVAWRALTQRTLHVRALSLDTLDIALPASAPQGTEHEDPSAPSTPLALPVALVVDHLALGRFALTRDGEPLPVSLGDLAARGQWDDTGLSLSLEHLALDHPLARVRAHGTATLAELRAPWPMQVALTAAVHSTKPASPLCALQAIPGALDPAKAGQTCTFDVQLNAHGSLNDLALAARVEGRGLRAHADAHLNTAAALPVRQVSLDIALANGSGLSATLQPEALDAQPTTPGAPGRERVRGKLSARRFDLGALLAGAIPPAVLNAQAQFTLQAQARETLDSAELTLDIAPGSSWNAQAALGKLAVRVLGPAHYRPGGWMQSLGELRITRLDSDLTLGKNHLRTQGSFGQPQANLKLDILVAQLKDVWPGLAGGGSIQGRLGGSLAHHDAELKLHYTPGSEQHTGLGAAPIDAQLSLEGGGSNTGWQGRLRTLHLTHAGIETHIAQAITLAWQPTAQAPAWVWQAGAGVVTVNLPGKHTVQITHQGSRAAPGRWETAGSINELQLSPALITAVHTLLDPGYLTSPQRGGVQATPGARRDFRIDLDTNWNLRFNGALAGAVQIARRSGDLSIPTNLAIPLRLRELALDIKATPTSASTSRIAAELVVATEKIGRIDARASTTLQGLELSAKQGIRTSLTADINDLSWVALVTGDSLEMGGHLTARIDGRGTLDGGWTSTGTVRADKLRLVRIDDGVRLFDGSLALRLDNEQVVLESLRFPAVRRITPSEWRTRTWIAEEADAQNGELRATGNWNLRTMAGNVKLVLHRFPILQRTDRYAMMSGQIDLSANLPSVRIAGTLTADAGWINPDILSSVPTVDDDVIIHRVNDRVQTPSGMDVNMDLTVDLGPRFYVVGMGIDAGLVGSVQVMLERKRLTGLGSFRTRGGRFEAYGQRLHVRRGVISFHENLANPRLDIEALRISEQVEAGVRITGTAQRPIIDLVSYPDVSDVDKLSWLILGRGADQSGSDAALLVSLGTSLLGGGEPFYRRFGLDDIGIKSGVMGSSGSLLPDTTVAGRVANTSDAELETQFMYASTRFANGISVGVEQALAGAETVARISYSLARGLSLDAKGGSINGLALVYRRLWGN